MSDHCPHCGKPIGDIVPIGAIRDQSHRGRAIIVAVADYYQMSVSDLVGKRRFRGTVRVRHVAMHVCHHCTDLSFADIGRLFGTDHSTTLKGIAAIGWLTQHDMQLSEEVRWLLNHCTRRDRTPAVVGGGPG